MQNQLKKQEAPAVKKQFFEEVDEASSLLKLVLRENADRRDRQSSALKAEDGDMETLDDSKQLLTTLSKERRQRREVKSVQGSTKLETLNGSLTMTPGM